MASGDGDPPDLPDELPLSDEELLGDEDEEMPPAHGEPPRADPPRRVEPVVAPPAPQPPAGGPERQPLPDELPVTGFSLAAGRGRGRGGQGRGRGRPKKAALAGRGVLHPPCGAEGSARLATCLVVGPTSARGAEEGEAKAKAPLWFDAGAPDADLRRSALVPHDSSGLGPPIVESGFAVKPKDTEALLAALALQARGAEAPEEDVAKVMCCFLGEGRPLVTSLDATSVMLGIERHKLRSVITRCASALATLSHMFRWKLEFSLLNSMRRSDLCHYAEFVQYDETPLPTRVVGDKAPLAHIGSFRPNAAAAARALADGVTSALVCKVGQTKMLTVKATQAQQKIMQTRQEASMVLRIGDRYATLSARSISSLNVLDRTTASAIMLQQQTISHMSKAATAFASSSRVVTTDAHASNIAAEAAIAKARGGGESHSLHILCNIHASALVYGKVFKMLDPQITGLIRVALSLRCGGAMTRFRAALRAEIDSRLEVLNGNPPAEAIADKKRVMRLFVSHGSAVATRRALLALCPNGEWRAPKVQYYVRSSTSQPRSRAAILEHVTSGVMVALASAQPALYNRSKWTGCDLAVDDLGVFEAVHRLLSTTYCRFCASYASGPRATQLLEHGKRLVHYNEADELNIIEDEAHAAAGSEEEADADVEEGDAEAPDGAGVAAGGAAPSAGNSRAADDASTWASENAAHRKHGLRFIMSSPLAWLVTARMLMEPMRQYMTEQFMLASERWDIQERAKAARLGLAGETPKRSYRLSELAAGASDDRFFQRVGLLLWSEGLWSTMPPAFHTFEKRAVVFQLVSRMGCAFNRLLAARHRSFPVKLFLLLADPSAAAELRAIPDCMLDPWSLRLRQRFPSLEGPELMQVLHTVACRTPVDVSHIEALHASIRRMLFLKSSQTHPLSLADLSAQWTFQQYRSIKKYQKPSFQPRTQGQSARRKARSRLRKATHGQAKQARGFGGAWRAWMRTQGRKRPDAAAVGDTGRRYQEAKRARTPEFIDAERAGRAATLVARGSGPQHAFGGSATQIKKSRQRLSSKWHALTSHLPDADVAHQAVVLAEHSVAQGSSVAHTVSLARVASRELAKRQRHAEEQDVAAIQNYREGLGSKVVDALKQTTPALQTCEVLAEPTAWGWHAHARHPDSEEVGKCA